jgi:hypothetical protein
LAVPDRSTLKGKRDYVILALPAGCALRRNELAEFDVATIQQREGRWVLADLCWMTLTVAGGDEGGDPE